MQLKGIAIVPTDLKASERSIRDITLEIASRKPDTLVLISPEGSIVLDALSVDYLTKIEADNSVYPCDMGILDELNIVFIREKLPSVFLNNEVLDELNEPHLLYPYVTRFLKLMSRVMPEYKIVNIESAPLAKSELLESGRSIREAIELSGHSAVIIVFSDLIIEGDPNFGNLLLDSLRLGDFLPFVEYEPDINAQKSYNALLMGIGATEQLKTFSTLRGKKQSECAFISFAVENMKIGEDEENKAESNSEDFIVPSIITRYAELEKEKRKELIKAESEIIKMVRKAVTLWVKERKKLDFDTYAETIKDTDLLKRLKNQKTGVFITVYKGDKLRGTMGTIYPLSDNIAEEIIRNSIEASMYDPQFIPVEVNELEDLTFKVTVMDPPERIYEGEKTDPQKQGLIVEQGIKRGVVLPGTPGVTSFEDQLKLAKDRGDISDDLIFIDPIIISSFTAEEF